MRETSQEYKDMLYIHMFWITDLTNWTLPAIESKDGYQDEGFIQILYAIGWR